MTSEFFEIPMNDSGFLFGRPSFFEGVGRILDFANSSTQYNGSLTEEQADLLALSMDWRLVGMDMSKAVEEFRKANGG